MWNGVTCNTADQVDYGAAGGVDYSELVEEPVSGPYPVGRDGV